MSKRIVNVHVTFIPKDAWVEGLYHASDSSECSMAANDAAMNAGIIAATRVSGKNYLEEILPEYSRY